MYEQFIYDIAARIKEDKAFNGLYPVAFNGDGPTAELCIGALKELSLYDENASAFIGFNKLYIPESAEKAVMVTGSRREAERILKGYKQAAVVIANTDDTSLYVTDLLRLSLYVLLKGRAGGVYSLKSALRSGFECVIPESDSKELYKAIAEGGERLFVFSDAQTDEFKALQQTELEILKETDRVCRENSIEYSLAGGTLLGAARHGGFIPWDYDIDIMMNPENFDKFSRLSDKFSSDYFLQTPYTDKGNYFFTKVRKNGTLMTTEMTDKLDNIHNGIFIDVFRHSYTARTKPVRKLHAVLTKCIRSLVYNKWNGTKVRGAKGSSTGAFVKAAATALKTILPMGFLCKAQKRIIDHYKHDTGYMYDGWGQNLSKGAFPSKWFDKYTEIEFEGESFPVIAEYEKYLEYLYGDYNTLPPVSKRHISHDIIRLRLN